MKLKQIFIFNGYSKSGKSTLGRIMLNSKDENVMVIDDFVISRESAKNLCLSIYSDLKDKCEYLVIIVNTASEDLWELDRISSLGIPTSTCYMESMEVADR